MKTIEINGLPRTQFGKKSTREIRKTGNVPCVIYGGKEQIHFHAHENSFKKLVYTPDAHIVNLKIEEKEHKAVLKDIQFHPVSDKIYHIDFMEVFDDKPVVINIPVKIQGDSIGVKAGGKLQIKKRHLKVKGLINDIPEFILVDITDINIHQSVKVGDLAIDKLELLDPKKSMILSVATSRVAQVAEEKPAEEVPAQEAAGAAESE
jgi:large subunit ribosomal protein L25